MTQLAPIILFVYNRPFHTEQVLNALLTNDLAKYSDLYIYADGPKLNASEEEKQKILEVRQYIRTITGFRSIKIIEQSVNKGLDPSEIDAITDTIDLYGKVIVLEDDVVVHPFFLRFMNEALEFYKDNKKVNSIGSYTPQIPYLNQLNKGVYASYRTATCGWATWKDRWDLCIWDKKYILDKYSSCNKFKYNRGGADLYDNLQDYLKAITDAWDARWQYSMYENNSVCIRPVKSLSYNIGFDGSGEHCGIIENEQMIFPTLYDNEEYKFLFEKKIKVSWRLQHSIRVFYKYDKTPLYKKLKWLIKERVLNLFN